MKILKYFALVVSILFVACHSTPPDPPPNTSGCKEWCDHATALGCEAAKTSASGATCLDVCANASTGPAKFDTTCRAHAATCDAADECENGPKVVEVGGDGVSATQATCANWCKHAADLKCPAAKPTPQGASCEDVCKNTQSGPVHFNLACRVKAKTCASADGCEH